MEEKASDRVFAEKAIGELRSLIGGALRAAALDAQPSWTDMRWDVVDVTATWSRGNERRNLHGWLTGDWPSFVVSFEGAAWEDNEATLHRRVLFFSGPTTSLMVAQGGVANPEIRVRDRESLASSLREFAQRVDRAELTNVSWDFRLADKPGSNLTSNL